MLEQSVLNQLSEIIKEENIKIKEPMSKHTTFKIGGEADCFVTPESVEETVAICTLCKKEKIPYYVIGNGSNLLVGDLGFRGIIIQIGPKMSSYTMTKEGNKTKVIAQAGMMLTSLAMKIANAGLTGFEFAAGIPGTLGGAVTMNAGAYGGEIKDAIVCATVIDENGEIQTLNKEQLQLGYRSSVIQKRDLITLEATFEFEEGKKEMILETIATLNRQRKEKQPLEYPSAGSTFKRPEGYFAGKLIMDSDLRGYRVGDVMVSEKHCGFVVNVGNGTAADVKTLMEDVDRIVYEKQGVHLEPEVRFLGEF